MLATKLLVQCRWSGILRFSLKWPLTSASKLYLSDSLQHFDSNASNIISGPIMACFSVILCYRKKVKKKAGQVFDFSRKSLSALFIFVLALFLDARISCFVCGQRFASVFAQLGPMSPCGSECSISQMDSGGGKLHFSNFELPALSWVWLMTCWAKLQARACLRIGSEHFTSLVNWCQQLLVVYFSLSVMQEKAIWLVYSVFQSLLIMTILKRLALSRELFWMENDFLAAFGLSAQAKKVMMVLLCTTSRSSWHKWSLISYG